MADLCITEYYIMNNETHFAVVVVREQGINITAEADSIALYT